MLTSLTIKSSAADSWQRSKSKHGFTMIEILVVVVIVGLIATVTGGVYMGTFKNMQLEKSAKELYLAAKYARLVAVEKQIECRLVIDKEEGKFFVYYKEGSLEAEGQGLALDLEQEQELELAQEEVEVVVSNPYTRPGELPEGVTFEELNIVRLVQVNEQYGDSGNDDDDDEEELENVIIFTAYGTADSALIKIGNGKTSYTVSVSPATGKVKIGRGEMEMPLDIIDLDEIERGNTQA